MILVETVPITISRGQTYYRGLGYDCGYGDTIDVRVDDLSMGSNKSILCACDVCDAVFNRQYFQLIQKKKTYDGQHLCISCIRKKLKISADHIERLKVSRRGMIGSRNPKWNPNTKAFRRYAYRVRNLTEKTYRKFKSQINPDDYPRGRSGIDGAYHLDHRISVKWAFRWGINPLWIAAKENLQMLDWKSNIEKCA